MTATATRITAADAGVTVISHTPAITSWADRYFGAWWNASATTPAEASGGFPAVFADVDPELVDDMSLLVDTLQHDEITYAKAKMLVAHDRDGAVVAFSPDEQLAYRFQPERQHLTIAGRTVQPVAVAASRLAREMVRAQLLRDGWTVLHASAADREGRTVLTFGSKGAGKTTVAMLLASWGHDLLANDRVLVRPEGERLRVLPWPSAAALGLGLLDALGLYDVVRQRLQDGEELHPTQHQAVTDALQAGQREPLWTPGDGKRERKAQLFPDQFVTWFGMRLATEGNAATLLFPRITRGADPALTHEARQVTESDFMSGSTEDRYPDVFGLAAGIDGGGSESARHDVAERLAKLPNHALVLGHDTAANTAFLSTLLENA
ncbi:hypothetical protein ACWEWX_07320 [Streptomyces asiaticus]